MTNKTFFAVLLVVAMSIFGQASFAAGDESAGCKDDSDCDGLVDAKEDKNLNGVFEIDLGETDFENLDTDGDGLTDGEEVMHLGRIADVVSKELVRIKFPDRLDPLKPDSDDDCLPDGLELGISKDEALALLEKMHERPNLEITLRCRSLLEDNFVSALENDIPYKGDIKTFKNIAILYDMDPLTVTDPTSYDTDDDGVMDGSEDVNFSGKRDGQTQNSTDGDSIVKWKELDPINPDSDGDGIFDGEEGDRNGDGAIGESESDPLVIDTDGDGIGDGEEFRLGTKFDVCDTDADGLSDGVEVGKIQPFETNGCHGLQPSGTNFKKATELDPLNPDSDGDGLTDGEEDTNGNGWLDALESDPTIPDTDLDGLSDMTETLGDFEGDELADFDLNVIIAGGECSPPKEMKDLDCDGVPNSRDDDSDNDGCPDAKEEAPKDNNNNSIPDVYDSTIKVCPEESSTPQAGQSSPEKKENESKPYSSIYPDGLDGGACSMVLSRGYGSRTLEAFMFAVTLFFISVRRFLSFLR